MASKLVLLAASSIAKDQAPPVTELVVDDTILASFKDRPLPPTVGSFLPVEPVDNTELLNLNLHTTGADGTSHIGANSKSQYGWMSGRGMYFHGYGHAILPRPGCNKMCLDTIYNSPPAVGCTVCTVVYGSGMIAPCGNCWECNYFAAVPPQLCFSNTQAGCAGYPVYAFSMQPNSYGRCGPYISRTTVSTQAGPTTGIAPITAPAPAVGPTTGVMYCMLGAMIGTANAPQVWASYPVPASTGERTGVATATGGGIAWQFWDYTQQGITAFGSTLPYMHLGFELSFCPTGCQFTTYAAASAFCDSAGNTRVDPRETVPYAGLAPFSCFDNGGLASGGVGRVGACGFVAQNIVFANPPATTPPTTALYEFFTWNENYWMCMTNVFNLAQTTTANTNLINRNKAFIQSATGFGYTGAFQTVCVRGPSSARSAGRRLGDVIDEDIVA